MPYKLAFIPFTQLAGAQMSASLTFNIERINEQTVMFSLPLPVNPDYPAHFHHLQQALRQSFPNCRDTIAGYRNLLAIFNGNAPEDSALQAVFTQLQSQPQEDEENVITIPVCYHPQLAPDLLPLSESCGLSVDELIHLHSAPLYTVYCIGFIPGFPFLGEVDPRIAAPRHAEPRREVACGSVGIAGRQTGIYPKASPGGWQLIGRTPLVLYDPENDLYSRFNVGMRVRFSPISLDDYHARTV